MAERPQPQRTCVGCRGRAAKADLVRIVRTPEGAALDPAGRAPGRGAYVHAERECVARAMRGSLARALRLPLGEAEAASLVRELTDRMGAR